MVAVPGAIIVAGPEEAIIVAGPEEAIIVAGPAEVAAATGGPSPGCHENAGGFAGSGKGGSVPVGSGGGNEPSLKGSPPRRAAL
jgi:hypothetical protein